MINESVFNIIRRYFILKLKFSKEVVTHLSLSFFFLAIGVLLYTSSLEGFVRNYIPDFLWSLAFALCIYSITNKVLISFIIVLSLAFIYEYLQLQGIVLGTFDWYDLFFYLLGSSSLFLQKIKIFRRKKDEEQMV